jgi:hypothetical protein
MNPGNSADTNTTPKGFESAGKEPAACCGGPTSDPGTCCALDARIKESGGSGCGCKARQAPGPRPCC